MMKHDFEQRRQQRIDSARKRAKKNEKEADSLYGSAMEMASHIPMGQPILVGHHSEKADRRYREKIDNKFRNASGKLDMAAYYERKADAIEGNDAISLDDPNASVKLEAKLQQLQDAQEFMKVANRCIRKRDREAFLKLPNASVVLWETLTTPDVMGDLGFAFYSLRNNSAKIRQVQGQLNKLKQQTTRQAIDKMVNGIRILENKEVNRLQMIFEDRPSAEMRTKLKKNGFRWSPSQGAWQRHISNSAFHAAMQLAREDG
ncbi:DUF3560 domain-containing protein [Pedobacter sp.]